MKSGNSAPGSRGEYGGLEISQSPCDSSHLFVEAKLERFVVFIEHERAHPVYIDMAAADMVEKSPRSGYGYVGVPAKTGHFLAHTMSAIESHGLALGRGQNTEHFGGL